MLHHGFGTYCVRLFNTQAMKKSVVMVTVVVFYFMFVLSEAVICFRCLNFLIWFFFFLMLSIEEKNGKDSGSGGIRTHASEETGALNQRLRPLGHATDIYEH